MGARSECGVHAPCSILRTATMETDRRSRALALVALGVAAAAGVWFFAGRRHAEAPESSASSATAFETRRERSRVALEDGSALELSAETRVEVVQRERRALRFSLRSGRVTCDVSKDEARSFAVVAGKVEV